MRSGWRLSQRSHETEWHCVASGDVARKAHECKQYEDNMNRKTYFCTRTYIKNHETNKCSNLIDGTNKMTNNNNNSSTFVTIKKIHLNNKWTIAIISRAFDKIGICLCLCVSVSLWVWYAWIESAKSICTAHLDAIKCENVVVYIDHNFIYLVIFPQFYWHSAKQRDKCGISSTIQRLYYRVRYSLANDVWLKTNLNI